MKKSKVGDLAATSPRAVRVFEVLGIDYCCADDRTLAEASAAAAADPREVVDLIQRRDHPAATATSLDWTNAPLENLTSHIVDVHHRRTRRSLIDLLEIAAQVGSAHAGRFPQLRKIGDAVQDLARDLVPHMVNEERYLFPYIASMQRPVGADSNSLVPLFGTVEYPLQSIRHDHSEDESILATIRELSNDFAPPERACAHVRDFYTQLQRFDRDLSHHIHLENDVLFPRAIALEKKMRRQPQI